MKSEYEYFDDEVGLERPTCTSVPFVPCDIRLLYLHLMPRLRMR